MHRERERFLFEGQDASPGPVSKRPRPLDRLCCPGPVGSWVPAALHPEAGTHKPPAPAEQRDPRGATLGVCQEDDNSGEGNGFLFVFKHKGKALLSLIRCHLKIKELYVVFPPAPPDSLQGGIEATLYSGLSVACLSSPSSPRGPASLPLKDLQL